MQNESAIAVKAEDKLRWLRRLDGGRGWESLHDHRCFAVAARLLAAGRCNSWAGRAGTGQYDLFARPRIAPRRPPIGATHMKAGPRQNSPPRDSVGHICLLYTS